MCGFGSICEFLLWQDLFFPMQELPLSLVVFIFNLELEIVNKLWCAVVLLFFRLWKMELTGNKMKKYLVCQERPGLQVWSLIAAWCSDVQQSGRHLYLTELFCNLDWLGLGAKVSHAEMLWIFQRNCERFFLLIITILSV